jgi:hypothetical protein
MTTRSDKIQFTAFISQKKVSPSPSVLRRRSHHQFWAKAAGANVPRTAEEAVEERFGARCHCMLSSGG